MGILASRFLKNKMRTLPKIINDWAFSGWDGGDIGHTFLISACKQEKPCK